MEAHPSHSPVCPGCIEAAKQIEQLKAENSRLRARNGDLEKLIEQLRRGGKRQAAPFSKGAPKINPKRPGRKPGSDYGTIARRAIPTEIDEELEAPLPPRCPNCHGKIVPEGIRAQYQTEIPVKAIHRKFNVHVGRCGCCGTRVQGRHPLQTSDALGACASQLGANAQAAIVHLNKQAGLSYGKITRVFDEIFAITLTRGGAAQALLRSARRCLPHYQEIVGSLPSYPWVVMDETGWRRGGLPAWLHVAVTSDATAYLIDRHRGFEGSSQLMPANYTGTMVHDGYRPYGRYFHCLHQTCLGHLLRRGNELLETARGGAARFPRQVKGILHEALETRDRRDAGEIQPVTAERKGRSLRTQMARLAEPTKTNTANETFAGHLFRQQNHLFTFLKHPGIDATNYRAEQALRLPITNRKVWGGNRTDKGTEAQGILCSVWATARQRAIQPFHWLSNLLRSPATAPSLVPDTG